MNSIPSALLIMLFASWTSSAMAGSVAASASSGGIRFSGTIVDGGCKVSPAINQQLKTACFHHGRTVTQTSQLDLLRQQQLPLNQGTTGFAWIDRSKNIGLLTIRYY